ncbi:uncharacterized protein [Aegilops tauschii subsp. strangulata]|uniref:F-box domain-containing protein n=1 Tax=Aegilops tauschii subsp. strangulata TaxID=200361 RepID=A0A453ANS9_AEGTS|nr:uncharacterized protein LOC109771847 [Aegilops tauschii subsp. strangulata]
MGRNSPEHRRRCPPRPPPRRHGPQDMASLPIPDELLAEIFVRLPTPTDLVRASAACVSFRRVVADRSFLRQFRKLHAPPLLGFLGPHTGFDPAERPHPSASAATAVALAADFSFSFLPAPDPAHRWVVWDVRDGRVLLRGMPLENSHGVVFTETVVCDPLHRRYLMLPSIPDDLAASVEGLRPRSCEIFLVPEGGDESTTAEETSFRVIWVGHYEDKLITYVFSSSTRHWQAIRSLTWTDLSAGLLSSTETTLFCRRQYVYGCFYWLPNSKHGIKMLVLNTRKMEFSIAEPPAEPKVCYRHITMVEAGEGRPGLVVLTYGPRGHIYTIWRNNNGSSSQWQKDKVIPPSPGSGYVLRHSMGTHLLLNHWGLSFDEELCPDLCTLDMKTLQIERVCASTAQSFAYSNYPPSLSSPTVSNDGY